VTAALATLAEEAVSPNFHWSYQIAGTHNVCIKKHVWGGLSERGTTIAIATSDCSVRMYQKARVGVLWSDVWGTTIAI
jgi:hypothetical protein